MNYISLLVSNGTNCLNLFHPISILFSIAASAVYKIHSDLSFSVSRVNSGNLDIADIRYMGHKIYAKRGLSQI